MKFTMMLGRKQLQKKWQNFSIDNETKHVVEIDELSDNLLDYDKGCGGNLNDDTKYDCNIYIMIKNNRKY